jgi:transposase InsO family protein
MPWKETDMRGERIAFVVRAERGEISMAALCREFGIARKTGYKWLSRYREVGSLAQFGELSRRPHHSPHRTAEQVELAVEALRLETGWGGRKLRRCLARQGIVLARSTVDRILARRGLIERGERHRPAVQRFQRPHPNDLLQMDFKAPYPLEAGGICYPLSILDDHSRFALGLFALPSQHTAEVQQSLIGCFERYGLPAAMLMDHGTPWWSSTNGHGLTRLGIFLIKQGVDLIYGGIGHPQTQGKVERFHRTLGEDMRRRRAPRTLEGYQQAFARFQKRYNEVRPHEALDDDTPQQHYQPSRRAYRPTPSEWEYPEGSEVMAVGNQGCLYLDGRYFFVCHALQGEKVRCERFGRQALISYRHMHVRELNLDTGETTAVVSPVHPHS